MDGEILFLIKWCVYGRSLDMREPFPLGVRLNEGVICLEILVKDLFKGALSQEIVYSPSFVCCPEIKLEAGY